MNPNGKGRVAAPERLEALGAPERRDPVEFAHRRIRAEQMMSTKGAARHHTSVAFEVAGRAKVVADSESADLNHVTEVLTLRNHNTSEGGGIGRRAGFRFQCPLDVQVRVLSLALE